MNTNEKPQEILSADHDYFEYEGYLVMKPKLPWVGASIYQGDGLWEALSLPNGDTELFPMDKGKALDILINGYQKLAK